MEQYTPYIPEEEKEIMDLRPIQFLRAMWEAKIQQAFLKAFGMSSAIASQSPQERGDGDWRSNPNKSDKELRSKSQEVRKK